MKNPYKSTILPICKPFMAQSSLRAAWVKRTSRSLHLACPCADCGRLRFRRFSRLKSIQKNGYVRGKVAEKGRGLLELSQLMAVHDDYELRDRLVALRQAIGPVGDDRPANSPDRSAAEISAILQQIDSLAQTADQDLIDGHSRLSRSEPYFSKLPINATQISSTNVMLLSLYTYAERQQSASPTCYVASDFTTYPIVLVANHFELVRFLLEQVIQVSVTVQDNSN